MRMFGVWEEEFDQERFLWGGSICWENNENDIWRAGRTNIQVINAEACSKKRKKPLWLELSEGKSGWRWSGRGRQGPDLVGLWRPRCRVWVVFQTKWEDTVLFKQGSGMSVWCSTKMNQFLCLLIGEITVEVGRSVERLYSSSSWFVIAAYTGVTRVKPKKSWID